MIKRLALVAVVLLMGTFLYFNIPQRVIQESTSADFVMDTPFKDVSKAVRKGKFEQETLRMNKAEVVSKEWLDKRFHVERPLKKDRYWEFSGRLQAKVRVDSPRAGKIEVELVEDVLFAKDRIEVKTQLARPLAIGVSDMYQEIVIVPEGDKTRVRLSSRITLKRFVPIFLADHARKQVKAATDDSVSNMESVIRNLRN